MPTTFLRPEGLVAPVGMMKGALYRLEPSLLYIAVLATLRAILRELCGLRFSQA
jgi:hypothetical protein